MKGIILKHGNLIVTPQIREPASAPASESEQEENKYTTIGGAMDNVVSDEESPQIKVKEFLMILLRFLDFEQVNTYIEKWIKKLQDRPLIQKLCERYRY